MRDVPLLAKLLSSDRCQSELMLGTGSHTRAGPLAWAISTRVVTSKVRHWPAWGAKRRSVVAAEVAEEGVWARTKLGTPARVANAAAPLRRERRTGVMKRSPK